MANENKIKTRVQMKADTANNWSQAKGFTPLTREPIFYTDTQEIRLGDGKTNVNDLPTFIKNVDISNKLDANGWTNENGTISKYDDETYTGASISIDGFSATKYGGTLTYGPTGITGYVDNSYNGPFEITDQHIIINDKEFNYPTQAGTLATTEDIEDYVAEATPKFPELAYSYWYDSVTIEGIGTCKESNLNIPSHINGLPVTSINDGAFKNCATIENVYIPATVESIGPSAFYNCPNLKQVIIEEGSSLAGEVITTTPTQTTRITTDGLTTVVGRKFTSDDHIQIGKDLREFPRTFEAIVYVPSDTSRNGSILSNAYYSLKSSGQIDFGIRKSGSTYRPVLELVNKEGYRTRFEVRTDLKGDAWNHVVITYDPSWNDSATNSTGNDIFTGYVNGEALAASLFRYSPDAPTTDHKSNQALALDIDTTQKSVSLYVGRGYKYGTSGSTIDDTVFPGKIKALALYSTVLSAEQITDNYTNGINPAHEDILLCYDLTSKESSTGHIPDVSGNGYDTVPLYTKRNTELNSDEFDYAFAVLGDTQTLINYDITNGTSYTKQIFDWLSANAEKKKIAHVLGVGDITENNTNEEWSLASSLYDQLPIPYTITWGSGHDGWEAFNTNFSSRLAGSDFGYHGTCQLRNYYRKFVIKGNKYLILCLESNPPSTNKDSNGDDVFTWAAKIIESNPDYRVIINTHYFLETTGHRSTTTGSRADDKWNLLADKYKNVEMILCGHIATQANIVRAYTRTLSGQTVSQFLINPQQIDKDYGYNSTGMVAMFYFSNNGQSVRVEYISTAKSTSSDVFYGRKNQFSFNTIGGEISDLPEKIGTSLTIESNAFGYCSNLRTLNVPHKTNYMGYNIFDGCEKLTLLVRTAKDPDAWIKYPNWNCSRPVIYRSAINLTELNRQLVRNISDSGESGIYQANTFATSSDAAAFGYQTSAVNHAAFATGYGAAAEGAASFATGYMTKATEQGAHAEGEYTEALERDAHAEGYFSKATHRHAHAEGDHTEAINVDTHTEGQYTVASGEGAHAEGSYTRAEGNHSHAEGAYTTASGAHAHAEGGGLILDGDSDYTRLVASGGNAHAEGSATIASGPSAHAEGKLTQAIGNAAHAEGENTRAEGNHSHTEGYNTQAIGGQSHAGGRNSIANAQGAFVHGIGLNTEIQSQTVFGKYNTPDSRAAFVMGNGTAEKRSNAYTLDWDGNAIFAGEVYAKGNKKLADSDVIEKTGENKTVGLAALKVGDYVTNINLGAATCFAWRASDADGTDKNIVIIFEDNSAIKSVCTEDWWTYAYVSDYSANIWSSSEFDQYVIAAGDGYWENGYTATATVNKKIKEIYNLSQLDDNDNPLIYSMTNDGQTIEVYSNDFYIDISSEKTTIKSSNVYAGEKKLAAVDTSNASTSGMNIVVYENGQFKAIQISMGGTY